MTALMHGTGGINGVRSIATFETWKFISHSKAAQKAKELNVLCACMIKLYLLTNKTVVKPKHVSTNFNEFKQKVL